MLNYPLPVALIVFLIGLIFALLRENNIPNQIDSRIIVNESEPNRQLTEDYDYNIKNDSVKVAQYNENTSLINFRILDPLLLWSQGVMKGGLVLGLTQLPLTSLNSIVSISDLSKKLYGSKRKVSSVGLAVSVGLTDMLFSFLGTMSVCHGAGGLAAQHRFGARIGWSVVFLGCVKIIVALAFSAGGRLLSGKQGHRDRDLFVLVVVVGDFYVV